MNIQTRRTRRVTPLLADLLIAVLVLALAAWGLDWASRISAQGAVARSVQHAQHLSERPTVAIHGWFFLPQVVKGRYNDVDITVHDLRDGTLSLSALTAHLQGVHVPLHAVVTGGVTTIFVEHSLETITFTYADLNAYLKSDGNDFTIAAGPKGQVQLTGHATILGQSFAVSADAVVRSVPGDLQITPTQLDTGTGVDSASKVLLGQRLTLSIPTAPFPFGQQVTSITPEQHHLTVHAEGTDVVIALPPTSGR